MDFNHLFTLIFGGIFGLVGLIFFCIGLGFGRKLHRRRMQCMATTDAYVQDAGGRRTLGYTVGGLTYERPCPSMGTRAWAIGQSLSVHYDPSDPGRGYIDGELTPETVLTWVFGGLGALFLLIAIVTALILL